MRNTAPVAREHAAAGRGSVGQHHDATPGAIIARSRVPRKDDLPACVAAVARKDREARGDRDAESTYELVERALAASITDLARAPKHLGTGKRGCLTQPCLALRSERCHRRGAPHSPGREPRARSASTHRLAYRRSIERHV